MKARVGAMIAAMAGLAAGAMDMPRRMVRFKKSNNTFSKKQWLKRKKRLKIQKESRRINRI